MDIKRTLAQLSGVGGRAWRLRLDELAARIWDLVPPAEPSPESERPPPDWDGRLMQENLQLSGYTFLGEDGPLRTLPCKDNVDLGVCRHIGMFVPVCDSLEAARIAATRELARRGRRARILGERRWISPVSIDAQQIYDLRATVGTAQAEYLWDELFHTDGSRDQPVWTLAKQPGCKGLYLPTDPSTLFVYERAYDSVTIGPRNQVPIYAPSISPQNALDFVRHRR